MTDKNKTLSFQERERVRLYISVGATPCGCPNIQGWHRDPISYSLPFAD